MRFSIYGYGKGKTEAGIGMAIRAIQNGDKVLYVQFLKDGTSSEAKYFQSIGIKVLYSKKDGVITNLHDAKQEKELLVNTLHTIMEDRPDLVILDEVFVCIDQGLIELSEFKEFLGGLGCDICMTGRIRSHSLRKEIVKLSDICSNSYSEKHSFNTHCDNCNQDYKYHYTYCPQCGSKLKRSEPAKIGRDF